MESSYKERLEARLTELKHGLVKLRLKWGDSTSLEAEDEFRVANRNIRLAQTDLDSISNTSLDNK